MFTSSILLSFAIWEKMSYRRLIFFFFYKYKIFRWHSIFTRTKYVRLWQNDFLATNNLVQKKWWNTLCWASSSFDFSGQLLPIRCDYIEDRAKETFLLMFCLAELMSLHIWPMKVVFFTKYSNQFKCSDIL